MYATLRATNNGKTVTSVYIIKLKDNGNDQYFRRYQIMNDNQVYLVDLNNQEILKTDIPDLTDIGRIKEYDTKMYRSDF